MFISAYLLYRIIGEHRVHLLFKKTLVLILMINFVQCSKGKTEPELTRIEHRSNSNVERSDATDLKSAIKMLNSAELFCGDECDPAVGMVGTIGEISDSPETEKKYTVDRCTGSLVGENIVATNAHCVPQAVTSGKVDCSKRMNILFPGGERKKCKKLLFVSPQFEESGHDFAFFEIEKLKDAKAISSAKKISAEKLSDGVKLSALVVDPDFGSSEEKFSGTFRKKSCHTVVGSGPLPNFGPSKEQLLVPLGTCDVRPGNSGAPIVDEQGHLRALVSRSINWMREVEQNWNKATQPSLHLWAMKIGVGTYCLRPGHWRSPIDLSKKECQRVSLPLSSDDYMDSVPFEKFKMRAKKQRDQKWQQLINESPFWGAQSPIQWQAEEHEQRQNADLFNFPNRRFSLSLVPQCYKEFSTAVASEYELKIPDFEIKMNDESYRIEMKEGLMNLWIARLSVEEADGEKVIKIELLKNGEKINQDDLLPPCDS